MADEVVRLPSNLIGLADRRRLESYGAHLVSHGLATRFSWSEDDRGDPHFEIFRGGADEVLAARVSRNRQEDVFYADDALGQRIVSGALDHVMAVLDEWLAAGHGHEAPPA